MQASAPNILARRSLLQITAGAAAAGALFPATRARAAQTSTAVSMPDVTGVPDSVSISTDDSISTAARASGARWQISGAEVTTTATTGPSGRALRVTLTAKLAIRQIRLRWTGVNTGWKAVLGDHWERSYGDLRWRPADSFHAAPWYALIHTTRGTFGVGVQTQPSALCHWRFDTDGIMLVCDVRSGGVGVELGDRVLVVCDVVAHQPVDGETSFQAARSFCRRMSPTSRAPAQQVYGFNDWYYAYGKNTPASLLADTELLAELSSGLPNRPYSLIDDGWQTQKPARLGQWSETRPTFPSMQELAAGIKKHDVRPGIWMRPLIDEIRSWPDSWHMKRDANYLDPSVPEVKNVIATDIRRLRDWGFEMIKHDFSTFDLLGRWGRDMHDGNPTSDGWSFATRKQTTAEIINDLYRTIRDAAGPAAVIGCDTMSHLAAGVFELNRIGDDTSGNEWSRNPQMGVNALAFRAAQQGAFYGADADCCPITTHIDFARSGKWLDLVARSGTPLFVSAERAALTPAVKESLKRALTTASQSQPVAEPLDWMTNPVPREWKLGGEQVSFDWA